MTKIATIAQLTFKEMIRQPIFVIVLLCGSILIYVSPWFSMFTLLNSEKLVRDMGFASILLTGILLAAFCASGLMFREIENKTAVTILSKPIYRFQFLAGKYAGLLTGMAIACFQLSIVLILTLRLGTLETVRDSIDKPVMYILHTVAVVCFLWALMMNYFFEKPFTSTLVITFFILITTGFGVLCFIDRNWHIQPFAHNMELSIFNGTMLLFWALAIICAIALAGSIRLNMLANLIFCLAFFFISMTSDYFFGRLADSNSLCLILYHIIPNLQFFWVTDAYMMQKTIPASYVTLTTLYSMVTIGILFGLSWVSFKEREIA